MGTEHIEDCVDSGYDRDTEAVDFGDCIVRDHDDVHAGTMSSGGARDGILHRNAVLRSYI
jgi:hypothetical protein